MQKFLPEIDVWLRFGAVPFPELTRGNRKSQFHGFDGELTSKVISNYLSRSQWLKLPDSLLVEESRVEGYLAHKKMPPQVAARDGRRDSGGGQAQGAALVIPRPFTLNPEP